MTLNISASRYFAVTGLFTLLCLVLYIASKPSWVQVGKERLGLVPILKAEDNSFYNGRIDPIFEKYCVACHDDNKDKGQLRLDSFRYLSFSGRSGTDLTAIENNLLIERMSLPATDRLAMPPYGRERHSDAELELIKLWLSKGGTGALTEADIPEAPAKAKVITFKNIDWQAIEALREPLQDTVNTLKQTNPHTLDYIARTSEYLSLDTYAIRTTFDDSALLAYLPLANKLSELKLAGTMISNNSIETIQSMTHLEKLDIRSTAITKKSVEKLLALPKLQVLFVDKGIVAPELSTMFSEKGVKLIEVKQG